MKNENMNDGWWHIPIIPGLGRLMQEDRHKFVASLGYIVQIQPELRSETLPNKKIKLAFFSQNITLVKVKMKNNIQ